MLLRLEAPSFDQAAQPHNHFGSCRSAGIPRVTFAVLGKHRVLHSSFGELDRSAATSRELLQTTSESRRLWRVLPGSSSPGLPRPTNQPDPCASSVAVQKRLVIDELPPRPPNSEGLFALGLARRLPSPLLITSGSSGLSLDQQLLALALGLELLDLGRDASCGRPTRSPGPAQIHRRSRRSSGSGESLWPRHGAVRSRRSVTSTLDEPAGCLFRQAFELELERVMKSSTPPSFFTPSRLADLSWICHLHPAPSVFRSMRWKSM